MARDVLGLFALRPNQAIRPERIRAALWPMRPPASAAANVRSHVAELRRLLAASGTSPALQVGSLGYELVAAADEVDALSFRRSVGRARAQAADGRSVEAAESYAEALALWRGPVLDGAVALGPVQPEAAWLEEPRLAETEEMTLLRLSLCPPSGVTPDFPA